MVERFLCCAAHAASLFGEGDAALLAASERGKSAWRDAALLERVTSAVDDGDDTRPVRSACFLGRGDLRGQLACDATEAEDHDIGFVREVRGATADLAQAKRIVHGALDTDGTPLVDDDGDVELRGALRDRDHAGLRRGDGLEQPRGDADRAGHSQSDDGKDGGIRPNVDRLDFAKRELLRECGTQRAFCVTRYTSRHRETDRMLR